MVGGLRVLIVAASVVASLVVSAAPASSATVALKLVASGFDDEVMEVAFAPGDDSIYVVEREGIITVVEQDGTVVSPPFLDLTASARSIDGLVFHPDYETNGLLYIAAVENEFTYRIIEYQVSGDPNLADVSTRRVVWTRERESNAHRGGQLAFGPDGYLYLGLGDGGPPPGDPFENGQDITTADGSIVRIDAATGAPAPGNPFIGATGDDSIWVFGFRNPWRFSFDATTSLLYAGEVGDGDLEEVNIISPTQAGANYGWDVMEGTNCFETPAPGEAPCGDPVYVPPHHQYPHSDGCAIIGGFVYRGSAIPALVGQYIYGDYCHGWVRSFEYDGSLVTNHQDWTAELGAVPLITTFGQDNDGELYIAANGTIFKIEPAGPPPATGTISGTVWDDLDEDGLQSGEPGVGGVRVALWTDLDQNGTPDVESRVATTNGSGDYSFQDVNVSGQYVVRFDAPAGRVFTTPNVGADDTIDSDPDPSTGFTSIITIVADEVDDTIDAGLVVSQFGTVGGRTWRDLNGDGIQDPGEPGYAGLWAWLYEDQEGDGSPDVKVAEARVDNDGRYDFPVDPAKDYFVRFGQQIFIDGALTLALPNRTQWSPLQVGSDSALDSDVDPSSGYAGPLSVPASTVDLTVDAGLVADSSDYGEVVAADGAVAHWRFGESSGTVAADAVGSNDGSIAGTIAWNEPGLVGDADTALRLDGTTTIEVLDSPDINIGGPYEERTVEVWFLADEVNNRQILFEEGGTARGLSIYLDSGRVYAGIWNRTDNGDGTTPWPVEPFLSAPVTEGVPFYVAFTYEFALGRAELYVNAALADSASGLGRWFSHGDDTGIGAMNGGTRFHTNGQFGGNRRTYAGVLDEVAVYNTVLSAEQIGAHFTGTASNEPPVVDAGLDFAVVLPADGSLLGSVSDEGAVDTTWAMTAGPAPVTFADPTNPTTTVSFSVDGVYTLRLTADDGEFVVFDEVVVTVDPEPPNQPPTVDAGSDDVVVLPDVASLDGTVTDDGRGIPDGSLVTTWSVTSGPGTVTFGDENEVDTIASFSVDGVYVLRLTADDGEFAPFDEVTITVDPEPPNQPPTVDAGSDDVVVLPGVASLDGTVTDDGPGIPDGSLTTTWSVTSGPGTVTFGNENEVDTTASFSVDGVYVLRLTADDGEFAPFDEVTITVDPEPTATYSEVVLADGPVAYWRFEELGGSTVTDSVGPGDGSIQGAPILGEPGLVAGSTAFRFDGTDDWIDLGDVDGVNKGGPFQQRTVELWFRADDVASRQVIYEEGSTSRGLSITVDGGNLYAGIWNRANGGGGSAWTTPIFLSMPIAAGVDYHVAFVFDSLADAVVLYVDGNEIASTSGVSTWGNHGGDIGIGAINGGTRFHNAGQSGGNIRAFDGVIDEVAIYGTALSAGQISAHYAAR